MLLLEKIVKYLSQLNEKLSSLDQIYISKNLKQFMVILEDLHNLLNESTYKGDIKEIQLRADDNENTEGFFVVEDYINSNLKYQLEKEMDEGFKVCLHVCQKYTPSVLKKTWHYIKIVLFDNPEQILQQKNILLLQSILNVRVELKEKNFAILFDDICQARQQSLYSQKRNKRIQFQQESQDNQQLHKQMNLFNQNNKQFFNGRDLMQDKREEKQTQSEKIQSVNINNQCKIFENQDRLDNRNNLFSNQKKNNQSGNQNFLQIQEIPQIINYKLNPYTHHSLLDQNDDHLQEIAIYNKIYLNNGLNYDGILQYKDFYVFQRNYYSTMLANKDQELRRISRNHASLRIKIDKSNNQQTYYLVNHSANGCQVKKNGQNDWIKIEDIGQEYEIKQKDTIGILFDVTGSELLIGYEFEIIS